LGEVTRPGAHLLARCLRAFSSSPEETARLARAKDVGASPHQRQLSRATRRSLLARAQGLVTLTANAALPYGYQTTARPPARQCAPRATSLSLGSLRAPLPFTLTAITDRASPSKTHAQTEPARDRILPGAARDDKSTFGPSATRDPRRDSRLHRTGLRFGPGLWRCAA
jgi:hypothetical protein